MFCVVGVVGVVCCCCSCAVSVLLSAVVFVRCRCCCLLLFWLCTITLLSAHRRAPALNWCSFALRACFSDKDAGQDKYVMPLFLFYKTYIRSTTHF